VLVGRVLDQRAEGGADSPHFQIRVDAAGTDFRVAVNVLSQQSPPELLFLATETFSHPLLQQLPGLAQGFNPLASAFGGLALDFIRGNLLDRQAMRTMPATAPGPDNDLADKLAHYVSRATADPDARLYAFGQRWGPESGVPDKIFGFAPGNGIHDVHMNQGNSGRFTADDGIWQDGGLLLHFPTSNQWVAIFLAFQSQAWHTDDRTGHAVPGLDQLGPGPLPSPAEPDRTVRIVAALVNPIGPGPEPETATLINPGALAVDLTGWRLVDRMGRAMILDTTVLPAGDTIRIRLSPQVQLSNSGGLLTLLNARGLKVDGIAYTAEDAHSEGKTLVF
jgi:uncharacterized protein YukJ